MDSRISKWLIMIAVLYLVFPRPVPDYLGRGLGLIDDLSLITTDLSS
jgi:uncharacterized membrane protein YkvA (DUF1232 family)